MIKNILILSSLVALFLSCKKDENINPLINAVQSTSSIDSMLPLSVGNYWIYQRSQDDSIGTYTMINVFDSLYIEKDSIILGEHYFKFSHSNPNFVNYFTMGPPSFNNIWIKDSLGFLIAYPREIILDPINLRDTIYRIHDYSINYYFTLVPDTFINRNFITGQLSGIWMKGYSYYGLPLSNRTGQHYFNAFAKNIGLLRSRRTFSTCPYQCRFSQHLIRYHLN